MRPELPGGEPENFGDEAGGQAVDAGLGRRPAQGAVGAAQLRLLLLLAQLPAVEGLQQLHGLRFPLGALAFYNCVSLLALLLFLSRVLYWKIQGSFISPRV